MDLMKLVFVEPDVVKDVFFKIGLKMEQGSNK